MTATESIAFAWDIKSVAPVQLEDGQLLIRGTSLNYEIDRELEAFAETPALMGGIQRFLQGSAPLCHHHDFKTVLGRVVSATPIAGKGVEVEAIVDYQPESSPWRHLYEALRRGRLSNLSWGGIFRRQITPDGPRIVDADFLELSVCAASVGKGTSFEIVAGKALSAPAGTAVIDDEHVDLDALDVRVKSLLSTLQHYKGTNMTYRDWFHDRPSAIPEVSPIEQRRIRDRNINDRAREEAAKTDTAGMETVEVRTFDLFGRGLRDRFGQPIQSDFTAEDLYSEENIPDTISGEDLALLLTGKPPEPPREMTVEEKLTKAARDAERRDRETALDLNGRLARLKDRLAAEETQAGERDRKSRFPRRREVQR
ncbi:MAG: hypothetical protein JWQ20_2678 [Conexibacter sp.]|nr:hypothetical protein [Conexibacter sp.]